MPVGSKSKLSHSLGLKKTLGRSLGLRSQNNIITPNKPEVKVTGQVVPGNVLPNHSNAAAYAYLPNLKKSPLEKRRK